MRRTSSKVLGKILDDEFELIKDQFGYDFARWLFGTAHRLGVSVFPASVYVLTRDILMCPVVHLPYSGVAGLAAVGLRRWSASPFVGFSYLPYDLLDREMRKYLPQHIRSKKARDVLSKEAESIAAYVRYLFGLPEGEYSEDGEYLFQFLVERGRFFPVVAKKRGETGSPP